MGKSTEQCAQHSLPPFWIKIIRKIVSMSYINMKHFHIIRQTLTINNIHLRHIHSGLFQQGLGAQGLAPHLMGQVDRGVGQGQPKVIHAIHTVYGGVQAPNAIVA